MDTQPPAPYLYLDARLSEQGCQQVLEQVSEDDEDSEPVSSYSELMSCFFNTSASFGYWHTISCSDNFETFRLSVRVKIQEEVNFLMYNTKKSHRAIFHIIEW
jgi:hypothetical protein